MRKMRKRTITFNACCNWFYSWNSRYIVTLCRDRLRDYFNVPDNIETIYLTLDNVPTENSYKVKPKRLKNAQYRIVIATIDGARAEICGMNEYLLLKHIRDKFKQPVYASVRY